MKVGFVNSLKDQ